jgi:NitT/TauT family transport system ATP-binding protein
MREIVLGDLVRLWTETRFTAVYVTHDLADALRLGHRIYVMSARPCSVLGIVSLDLPLDERSEDQPAFAEARRCVLDLIRNPVRRKTGESNHEKPGHPEGSALGELAKRRAG